MDLCNLQQMNGRDSVIGFALSLLLLSTLPAVGGVRIGIVVWARQLWSPHGLRADPDEFLYGGSGAITATIAIVDRFCCRSI